MRFLKPAHSVLSPIWAPWQYFNILLWNRMFPTCFSETYAVAATFQSFETEQFFRQWTLL